MLEFLFNKVAGFQVYNFIKKSLQHRCFPVRFAKFLRTTILKIICERLLLSVKVSLLVNPLHVTSVFLYPMNITENLRFIMLSVCIEKHQWHERG